MAIPISYNIRNLFVRRLATTITIVGIALVVAVFIAVLALASGFERALAGNGLDTNAIVLRVPGNDELSSSVSREWVSIIQTQPEVAIDTQGRPMIVPELVVVVNLKKKSTGGVSNILTRGTSPAAFQLRPRLKLVAGRMWNSGLSEIIVGKLLSERFQNCGLGEKVNFGGREWTVVGIFDAGGTSFESEVWGDSEVLGPAFDREGYQSATVRLKDPAFLDAFKQRLEGDRRMQAVVKRESVYYSDQSVRIATIIRVLGTFIAIVMAFGAVFGALNTMYAAVSSRRAEIGTMMALGFSRSSVLTSFVLESLFLSGIGGVLGALFALPINGISTGTTNWATFSEVAFRFTVTPTMLVAGFIFALVMGLVGGFFPALSAARANIAQTVRRA
ncbi:MAG: ABC transporter permease [Candidatus Eisenbacteria bacterium]|nr:ABC transporter permease [Candidatus Eisenbacteria bacterium]